MQTAMCRRCQRPGGAGARRGLLRTSSDSSDIAEGAASLCPQPGACLNPSPTVSGPPPGSPDRVSPYGQTVIQVERPVTPETTATSC